MCVSFSLVAFVAFVDFVETAHARPSENKFSWCSLNRSLDFVDFVELFHVRHCSNEFGSVLT